jgi:hypothetical protein
MVPTKGRPRVIAGGVRVAVFLSAAQAAWLREQPHGNSETVRQLIDKAMEMADETFPRFPASQK